MPCKGCDNPEYKGVVKLRYLGDINDWGGQSFVTGRIYTMPARYANREAYPLFELIAVMPGAVIPDKYRFIEKRVEVPVEKVLVEAPVVEGEAEEEEVYLPEPDEPAEPVVTVRAEMPEPGEKPWDSSVSEEDEFTEIGEYASSIGDARVALSRADMIAGMDTITLKAYIVSNGGKVDNRWGLKKLIEEAQKLQ